MSQLAAFFTSVTLKEWAKEASRLVMVCAFLTADLRRNEGQPVFDAQVFHPAEFGGVRRDEGKVVGEADRGDEQIVRADDAAAGFEIVTEAGVVPGGGIIEGQGNIGREGLADDGGAAFRLTVFQRAVQQLRADDGARDDGSGREFFEPGANGAVRIFQVVNPRVGVEQAGHHQRSRVSTGLCAGRSRGSPAKAPAVCSK